MSGILRKALMATAMTFAAVAAQSAVVYQNLTPTGALASPGSVSAGFATGSGAGSIVVQIQGYLSIDGVNCCTDTFTLSLDSVVLFEGAFDMGGGGTNTVTIDPNGATWSATSLGFFAGGTLDVSIPVAFGAGAHTLTLAYGGAAQGTGDEGWGVNFVTVTGPEGGTTHVPEPATLVLVGLGMLGTATARRRRRG